MNRLFSDSAWASDTLKRVPLAVSEVVLREWEAQRNRPLPKPKAFKPDPKRGVFGLLIPDDRNRDANIWLRKTATALDSVHMPTRLVLDDDDIRFTARALANRARGLRRSDSGFAQMASIAKFHAVRIPDPDRKPHTLESVWARLTSESFWMRALRRSHAAIAEHGAIIAGRVHNRAGLYASDGAVKRRAQRKRHNAELLASLSAVNEEGDQFTLAELAAKSASNPYVRRAEMMVRVRGFETYAKAQGHICEFYTLTAPSAYHRILSKSGQPNPNYNNASPKQTQAYLQGVWSRIRAKLNRLGVRIYGFRVAEPHHDGTPHWHMLIFCQPEDKRQLRKVMRFYALQEDGHEKGAWRRRFTAVAINPAKGTPSSYISKYISKNVDGKRQDMAPLQEYDHEAAQPTLMQETAFRVETWSGQHRIRQFQQIGCIPVTVWRELRRLEVDQAPQIGNYINAADGSDWCRYVHLMGGAQVKRKDLPLASYRVEKVNAYGELVNFIKGISFGRQVVISRVHEWKLTRSDTERPADDARCARLRAGGVSRPWTRVNNCTLQEKHDSDPTFHPIDFSSHTDHRHSITAPEIGPAPWLRH